MQDMSEKEIQLYVWTYVCIQVGFIIGDIVIGCFFGVKWAFLALFLEFVFTAVIILGANYAKLKEENKK